MVVALMLLLLADLDDAGQTEVGDSQREGDGVNQNVGGLEVSVHHPAPVQVAHRSNHLLHQMAHGVRAELRPGPLLQPKFEVDAAVLKHDVQHAEGIHVAGAKVGVGFRLKDIDHLDDVRVIQPPQDGNFAKDAQGVLRRLKNIRNPLDDDGSVGVVAVKAPAHLPVRAAAHPFCNGKSTRDVPLCRSFAAFAGGDFVPPVDVIDWPDALKHFLMASEARSHLSSLQARTI
jgi:hypothetical protein